jgi:hypothetical protein
MESEDAFKERAVAAFREARGDDVMANLNKVEFITFLGRAPPIRLFQVSVWRTSAEGATFPSVLGRPANVALLVCALALGGASLAGLVPATALGLALPDAATAVRALSGFLLALLVLNVCMGYLGGRAPVLSLNLRGVCDRNAGVNMRLGHAGASSSLDAPVVSSDADFDRRYAVSSDDAALARAILGDAEVRRLVRATDDASRFERLEMVSRSEPGRQGVTYVEVEFRPEPLVGAGVRPAVELVERVASHLSGGG